MIQNFGQEKNQKIYQNYEENTKTLFKLYYFLILLFLAYAITAFISSKNLRNEYSYYDDVQLSIIILASISILLEILTIYLLKTKFLTHLLFFLLLVIKSIMYTPLIIQLVSFLLGCFDKYCGQLIRHDGYVSPWLIVFNLQNYYPSCSQMQSSGDLVDQMIYNSVKIIIQECKYEKDQQSCYQFDTLQINNWNDMFVLQIVSFCLGSVWILCAGILIILFKVKHVQSTQKADQEIKYNQQVLAQQGQVAFFQPVMQQALPQQSQNQYQNPQFQNNQQVFANQQEYAPPPLIIQQPQFVKQNQEYAIGQPVKS
ncbi:hypothetical protein ABPG72_022207 [Tetrahymena utriculariae]